MGILRSNKSLLKAAVRGDRAEVESCLKQDSVFEIDANARDADGMTALNLAAKEGHLPIIDLLLLYEADKDIANNEGYTPLLTAVNNGKTQAALRLIKAGADVNAHEDGYIYALHIAAFKGDVDVVKALAEHGADLNALILANGRTALHWAVDKEFTAAVEALVKAGARQDIADKSGILPRDIASKKANAKFLLKILDGGKPAAATQAPTAEKTAAGGDAAVKTDSGDSWARSAEMRLSHVGVYPDINRRITEIFNFETRERTVIAENLKTGAETLTAPESFDNVTEEALKKALAEFQRLGGSADENAVLGARAGRKMFKL